MKHTEMELARREKCDFIQTWHWAGNPNFNAAIVPGLKEDLLFIMGSLMMAMSMKTGAMST